jgi:hypothetical protein
MSDYIIHTTGEDLPKVLKALNKLGIQHDPPVVSKELFDTVEMVITGDERTVEIDFKLSKEYTKLDLFKKL